MHIRQIAQHLELGNISSQEGNLCVTWNMNKEGALRLLVSSSAPPCWAIANFYHHDEDTLAPLPWLFKCRAQEQWQRMSNSKRALNQDTLKAQHKISGSASQGFWIKFVSHRAGGKKYRNVECAVNHYAPMAHLHYLQFKDKVQSMAIPVKPWYRRSWQ